MTELAGFSGKRVVRKLEKLGFRVLRQKGSHARMYSDERGHVTVPMYKEIGTSLLRKIIHDAGLDTQEFLAL